MADAGSEQNEALVSLLARAQWSPENLGMRLNALAAKLGLRARLHPKSPVRWVRTNASHPELCVPREPWPALVCLLLHQRLNEPVTPEMLGWPANRGLRYVAANDGLSQPWDAAGAIAALGEVVDADSMERRHFMTVTGLTLTATAYQWLGDPARVAAAVAGKRVDHTLVDNLEQVAGARRLMDDAVGGGGLLPAVREDLRLVAAMLRNSAYTEQVGKRLHAVAAEFGRLAGWLAFDSGRPAHAQRYFLAALRAAHVSGDRAVGANVLAYMSIQAAFSEQPKDAVLLAEAALKGARDLTPAVAASLHARLARGAAYAGEFTTWDRAQDRAFDLLTRSVPDNEPSWIYFFTEDHAHGIAGESLLALDRPRQAEAHLRQALVLLDPAFTRERAQWLCRLATARVRAGSVEQGCATAREAATVIRRLDSPRVQRQLAEFRQAAAPYAGSTAVREFDADYRDLLPRN